MILNMKVKHREFVIFEVLLGNCEFFSIPTTVLKYVGSRQSIDNCRILNERVYSFCQMFNEVVVRPSIHSLHAV